MQPFRRIFNPYVTVQAVNRRAVLAAVPYARRLIGLTINGPDKSAVVVYLGVESPSARIDQTARGSSNTADYTNPRVIPAGQTVIVVWSLDGAASATFALEEA
jgi:hypothetical protein